MVGVAVNVTDVPAQMVLDGEAAMPTLAGRSGLTVMVTGVDVAGVPVAQAALEVIVTVITSSVTNVVEV